MDSHRTTQPKDYGIMAGQIWWLRRVVVFALPPFGTYSVSFWFFTLSALIEWLSFFSVFLFWKIFFEREFQYYNQQMQDTPCIYGSE